ncbi:MAG: hypothetical protein WD066_17895 [Planctomycetaceae bacterium]
MKAYETSATVERDGDVRVVGVPFSPGTEVEVTIAPKRKPPEEFAAAWRRLTRSMRAASPETTIAEDEIQREIDEYRAGR